MALGEVAGLVGSVEDIAREKGHAPEIVRLDSDESCEFLLQCACGGCATLEVAHEGIPLTFATHGLCDANCGTWRP